MSVLCKVAGYVVSRWKVWVPPVVLTLVVFVGLIVFVKGGNISIFSYKLF